MRTAPANLRASALWGSENRPATDGLDVMSHLLRTGIIRTGLPPAAPAALGASLEAHPKGTHGGRQEEHSRAVPRQTNQPGPRQPYALGP